jgi:hypothetical protein
MATPRRAKQPERKEEVGGGGWVVALDPDRSLDGSRRAMGPGAGAGEREATTTAATADGTTGPGGKCSRHQRTNPPRHPPARRVRPSPRDTAGAAAGVASRRTMVRWKIAMRVPGIITPFSRDTDGGTTGRGGRASSRCAAACRGCQPGQVTVGFVNAACRDWSGTAVSATKCSCWNQTLDAAGTWRRASSSAAAGS